jgi:hypothetical protein
LFWSMVLFCVPLLGQSQFVTPNINTTILNQNLNQTVNTDLANDPLRDGAFVIINDGTNSVDNIIGNNQQIGTFGNAKNRVINILNTIINYTLGLLAMVALVYLMYHGILILTAAGDEERFNNGLKGIKYAAIALGGIGLSWFVISLIFYLIDFII